MFSTQEITIFWENGLLNGPAFHLPELIITYHINDLPFKPKFHYWDRNFFRYISSNTFTSPIRLIISSLFMSMNISNYYRSLYFWIVGEWMTTRKSLCYLLFLIIEDKIVYKITCSRYCYNVVYHDVDEIIWPQPITSLKLGHVIGQGSMSPTWVGRVSDLGNMAFIKSVKTWIILLYIWLHLWNQSEKINK